LFHDASLDVAEAATTVVAAVVTASCTLIAHLGDSRAYLYGDQHVHCLTRDHSITQTLIDAVEITAHGRTFPNQRANAGPDQSHGLSNHSREGAPTHAASPRTIHRF
jgi:serine/threonine protein phosphatase PrpC